MELFKITCVTCRAGLSVRNESLIGQIVACPKCGSMVQIERPTEGQAIAESPVNEPTSPEAEGSFAFLAWSAGALAMAAMIVGAILLWPATPEVSDAAAPIVQPAAKPSPTVDESEQVEPEAIVAAAPEVTEPAPTPPQETTEMPAEVAVDKSVTPTPSSVEPPPVPPASVDEPRVTREFDALELDPEGLDLATLDRAPSSAAAATSDGPPPSPEPMPSTEPAARRGAPAERNIINRDAEDQFARRIPALSVREMPLVDFLGLVSQLGGAPVSVAAEQLLMAGISPRKPVSVTMNDQSVDAILAAALKPLRLEHKFYGPQVVVVRQGAEQFREIKYPVDDLPIEPARLAKLIGDLIEPASWKTGKLAVDGQTLVVTQSQRVHYQILLLLERLRLANNISPRSKFPTQRLAPSPLHGAMAERLAGPALFTFTRETPLVEVFGHWQREIDVPILVDWPALADVDLWPESVIVCAVADRPWGQALSESLEPLGLSWQATFGGAITITSADKLQRNPQLEVYALTSGTIDLAQALEKQLGAEDGAFVVEPAARVLFALQPAGVQREVLEWLNLKQLLRKP